MAQVALGQTAAAVIASSVVSPAMTVIDLSIIRAQFNKSSMGSALRSTTSDLLSGRMRWNPALSIMSTVYTSTYMTANYTSALCQELGIDYKIPTAVATSLVNITAIAYKDREFARMCSKAPTVFPLSCYGLFALRDGLTVTSSFVLKNTIKERLEAEHGLSHNNADLAASFAVPMIAQLASTPLHILSLDIYSHPESPFRMRMKEIAKGYMSVCSGRVLRIIPAFGNEAAPKDLGQADINMHHGASDFMGAKNSQN
ncbi:hypothetical protein NSK_004040 [Nannochloropsis salina CCMP1776]|uniref:Uncharacterized protein n=1 Tax=Nannochloropsis salina CCMP1776 TaxID=1027361 RepID=A0A4D9D549_9STRA|nr:hypothetical protein NSK_004040 [Nannochloropsis salina CCMP1776]|eukprot:TFJ84575.1 hypothetical protein NSK_004040 [Nannochloropsis salina CCMP1776]